MSNEPIYSNQKLDNYVPNWKTDSILLPWASNGFDFSDMKMTVAEGIELALRIFEATHRVSLRGDAEEEFRFMAPDYFDICIDDDVMADDMDTMKPVTSIDCPGELHASELLNWNLSATVVELMEQGATECEAGDLLFKEFLEINNIEWEGDDTFDSFMEIVYRDFYGDDSTEEDDEDEDED